VPWGDHQDALAAASADELGEDHADLQRLAQSYRVGDEQAGAQRFIRQCFADRAELVVEVVGEHGGRNVERLVVQGDRSAAQRGLEPEPGAAVPRGVVRHHGCLTRIEGLNPVEVGVERRGGVPDVRASTADLEEVRLTPGRGGRGGQPHRSDEPLLVSNLDRNPRGEGDLTCVRIVDGGGTAHRAVSFVLTLGKEPLRLAVLTRFRT